MPDKGERIKKFLDTLQKELSTRQQNAPSNRVSLTDTDTNHSSETTVSGKSDSYSIQGNQLNFEKVPPLRNNAGAARISRNEYISKNESSLDIDCNKNGDFMEHDLEKTFQGLNVADTDVVGEMPVKHKHQFEIALERAEQNKDIVKHVLPLNRLQRTGPAKISSNSFGGKAKGSGSVVEESAVCPPSYKHSEVKVISVAEALELQQQQHQRQEELQAKLAAEKLAQRLHIQMEAYNPEGVDMSYRVGADRYGEDIDSDDESRDADDDDDKRYNITVSDTED